MRCRVVDDNGGPLTDAVVELLPADQMEVGRVAATDGSGLVTFGALSAGAIRLVAHAKGHTSLKLTLTLPAPGKDPVILKVSPKRDRER